MLVKEVMSKNVVSAPPEISTQEAAKLLNDNGIGCLVIASKDRLLGILTERDIVIKLVMDNLSAAKTPISKIMTKNPVLIEEDAEISDAVEAMVQNKIKRLPVVSGHTLVGIITTSDIAAAGPKEAERVSQLMVSPKRIRAMAG